VDDYNYIFVGYISDLLVMVEIVQLILDETVISLKVNLRTLIVVCCRINIILMICCPTFQPQHSISMDIFSVIDHVSASKNGILAITCSPNGLIIAIARNIIGSVLIIILKVLANDIDRSGLADHSRMIVLQTIRMQVIRIVDVV